MESQEQLLRKIFTFFVCVAITIPLIVLPNSTIFPFIVPKVLVFRSAVIAMAGVYTLLYIKNKEKYKPKVSIIHAVVALSAISLVLSAIFGVDFANSFWSGHERMIGVFSILHYYLFFFLLSQVYRTKKDWKPLIYAQLIVGSLVGAISFIQFAINPEFLLNQGNSRVISTLGNPIYVGAYGTFVMFLSAYAYIKEKRKIFFLSFVMGLFSFLFSGSRGPFLGLIAGIPIAGLIAFFTRKQTGLRIGKKAKTYIQTGIVFVAIIATALFAFRNQPIVQELPIVGRIVSTGTYEIFHGPRALAAKTAVTSWKERPFFGWGQGNFAFAFNVNFPPQMLQVGGLGEMWFDNAHNMVVETLAAQGIFGELVYVFFLIFVPYFLIDKKRKGELSASEFLLSLAFFFVYIVANITVFDNATSLMYYTFFLALIHSQTEVKESESTTKNVGLGLISIIVIFVYVICVVANYNIYKANYYALETMRHIRGGLFLKGMEYYDLSFTKKTPHTLDINFDVARTVADFLGKNPGIYYKEPKVKASVDKVLAETQKSYDLHPLDARMPILMATVLRQRDLGQSLSGDAIAQRIDLLESALEISPYRQNVIFELIEPYALIGQIDKSIAMIEDSLQYSPTSKVLWYEYYITLDIKGDKQKMLQAFMKSKDLGVNYQEYTPDVQKILLKYNISI